MADLVVTVPSGTLTLPADVIVPAARIPDLPADAVSSVNGETGAVVLDAADVGAATAAQGAKADAALPAANLDTSVTALDADAGSALRVQQDARLSSTYAAIDADLGGDFTSGTATVGQVPLADGSGGVAWGAAGLPADGTPVRPTLLNSWVDFDAARQVEYWVDALGNVNIRGVAKSGTIGQAIFTLPEGMRPLNIYYFSTVSNNAFGHGQITTAGNVVPSGGSASWFALNGLRFRVDV